MTDARPRPSPDLRGKQEAKYGRKTLAMAKAWGITPWEIAGWLVEFRHDEHVEFCRPRSSLMPEWAIRLAAAMIEHAANDLKFLRSVKAYYLPPEYRPDPLGARDWFLSDDDRALSLVWCAQVLNIPIEAIRKRYVGPR